MRLRKFYAPLVMCCMILPPIMNIYNVYAISNNTVTPKSDYIVSPRLSLDEFITSANSDVSVLEPIVEDYYVSPRLSIEEFTTNNISDVSVLEPNVKDYYASPRLSIDVFLTNIGEVDVLPEKEYVVSPRISFDTYNTISNNTGAVPSYEYYKSPNFTLANITSPLLLVNSLELSDSSNNIVRPTDEIKLTLDNSISSLISNIKWELLSIQEDNTELSIESGILSSSEITEGFKVLKPTMQINGKYKIKVIQTMKDNSELTYVSPSLTYLDNTQLSFVSPTEWILHSDSIDISFTTGINTKIDKYNVIIEDTDTNTRTIVGENISGVDTLTKKDDKFNYYTFNYSNIPEGLKHFKVIIELVN